MESSIGWLKTRGVPAGETDKSRHYRGLSSRRSSIMLTINLRLTAKNKIVATTMSVGTSGEANIV
ncbi:hypothetical protein Ccrd_000894 [Cynara cardunculus var. scolymus]|uniref:Uncharacterized protein n=1 Tax=Cynara cardunculus var. scolymus TaxID=59895 RepID=A0A124SDH9_CYNCS|nr:hypothetical protein Ccrd_000894 [Cynara cardunculus var. scolymus]